MDRTSLNSGLGAHRPRRYSRKADSQPQGIPEDLTTVDDLLGWVGEDRARAELVLANEDLQPEEDRRSTLTEPLNALLAAPPEGSEEGVEEPSTTPEGDAGANPQPDPQEGVQEDGTMAEPVEVPDGMTKVKDLEEWVGTDAARAAAVYDAEVAKAKKDQRSTLLANMEQVMANSDDSDII